MRNKQLDTIDEVHVFLNDIYLGYESASWAWCADLIKTRTGRAVDQLTADDLAGLLHKWQNSSVKLNNMILRDAEKEFSKRSQTGFGIDGDASVAERDFDAVRGTYDANKFVKETLAENEKINAAAEKWTALLKQ